MTKLTKSLGCVAAMFTASFFGTASSADAQTFDVTARGFYMSNGFHTAFYDGYLTGWDGGLEYRSFFVFDIPELTETAEGATLSLWMPVGGYSSDQSFETLALWSVETSISSLVANYEEPTPESEAIYTDLGSGTSFGSTQVTATETGAYFTVTLTSAGVAALNAAQGSQIAIGASITSLTYGPNPQQVFLNSDTNPSNPNSDGKAAQISVVPEPTTVALLGLSAGAILFFRRRSSAR